MDDDLTKPAMYPRIGNIRPKYRSPLQQTEMRERPIDPVMGALKSLADKGSELLDRAKATPYDVTRAIASAVPFQGPELAKTLEQSTLKLPVGVSISSQNPGFEIAEVPTKEMLEAMPWSELVGTAGTSRLAESLGYGQKPELFDVLDAAGVAGMAGSAAKMGKTAAKGAAKAGKAGAEMMGEELNRRMLEGRSLTPIINTPAPVNFVVKPKGGNWITDSVEKAVKPLMHPMNPNEVADIEAHFKKIEPHYDLSNPRDARELEEMRQHIQVMKRHEAVNQWIDRNLTNYFTKQMATPEDPVRKLAEEGITHIANIGERDINPDKYLKQTRAQAGFPEQGMGQSDIAKRWEIMADEAIGVDKASEYQRMEEAKKLAEEAQQAYKDHELVVARKFDEYLKKNIKISDAARESMNQKTPIMDKAYIIDDTLLEPLKQNAVEKNRNFNQGHYSLLKANPWVEKIDPNTNLYTGYGGRDLGFDHIVDVLKQDLTSGRIRPEQLSKVSMEQAVRRTYEFDQEMAKKMADAQIKATEGMPVHKEYPEGYKWIELAQPKIPEAIPEGWTMKEPKGGVLAAVRPNPLDPHFETTVLGNDMPDLIKNIYKRHPDTPGNPNAALEQALKYEGDTMGHCVGGYCPDVASGRSRIYSLRDPKGEPHVTVEVNPSPHPISTSRRGDEFPELKNFVYGGPYSFEGPYKPSEEQLKNIYNRAHELWKTQGIGIASDIDRYAQQAANEILGPMPQRIVQIKGKQNRAPNPEYLTYVQDFVRSGNWSDIGDIHNTGMRAANSVFNEAELEKLRNAGVTDMPKILSGEEIQKYHNMIVPEGQRLIYDSKGNITGLEGADGMKRGGKVHVSDDCDCQKMAVMDQHFGVGGAVEKALKLARAASKTKPEIEAIAQRIAPQMTGEFVRGEKGTQSVAGKTQKQFAREKELEHKISKTVEATPEKVDYEKLKGNVVIGIPGDPTITGQAVEAVAGSPLQSASPQHGGPLYGLGRDDSHFWASQLGAARRVQNLAKEVGQQYEQPVLGQYIMMGPESINYALHYADANLQAIDPSKMRKSDIEGFNRLIRQGSEKSGPRPGFPGIENPDEAYLHFAVDPELRKHFNALMQMPTVTERFRLPSGIDVRHAVTEPELRNLETGVTGYSIGQMRPDIEDLKLSEHPTYSHDIPGHFLGQSKYPLPYELMFPDTLKAIRENPSQAPHEFGSLKMVGPRQTIDQQMIDEIKQYEEAMKALTGKKKGGKVQKKAGGGVISKVAREAIEKMRPLKAEMEAKGSLWSQDAAKDAAKYTRDVQQFAPTQAEIDAEIKRLQSKGQQDLPGMAGGGEISGDDLIIEERPL